MGIDYEYKISEGTKLARTRDKGHTTLMATANDRQIGGNHYKTPGKLEHWDLVGMFEWDYFQGQITKYLMRWRKKNGLEDLEKARHYLDKYIELERSKEEIAERAIHPDRSVDDAGYSENFRYGE